MQFTRIRAKDLLAGVQRLKEIEECDAVVLGQVEQEDSQHLQILNQCFGLCSQLMPQGVQIVTDSLNGSTAKHTIELTYNQRCIFLTLLAGEVTQMCSSLFSITRGTIHYKRTRSSSQNSEHLHLSRPRSDALSISNHATDLLPIDLISCGIILYLYYFQFKFKRVQMDYKSFCSVLNFLLETGFS